MLESHLVQPSTITQYTEPTPIHTPMLQQYLLDGSNDVPQVSYMSTPQYDQGNDSIPYQAPRPMQTPNTQPITFWSSDNIREYLKHLELTGFKNANQR